MNKLKISVIVPIYKVEQYLERCIQSILCQDIQNMEIILVDDGSPDKCGSICDQYAKEYENIKVIHKVNGGLSDARNAGIKEARGEYISCIDSDDYIEGQMLSELCELLDSTKADIAVSGINTVVNDRIVHTDKYEFKIYEAKDAICAMLYEKKFWVAAWNKIYRKELFEDYLYPKGRLYEDYYLTPRLMHRANKVVVSDKVYYQYCIREDSIMGMSDDKLSEDIIYNSVENINFFEERRDKYTRKQYDQIIAGIVDHLYSCSRQVFLEKDKKKYREYIKIYKCSVRKIFTTILINQYIPIKKKGLLLLSMCSFSFLQKIMIKYTQM